jgi:hypothetical protein
MGGEFFFTEKFEPRFKPRENVQIAGEFYEVVETRPMFAWDYKLTNITADTTVDLKEAGLKGLENELLNVRVKIQGPVKVLFRLEGAGGPVFGGWGGAERTADERTSPQLLEFLILGETYGWLYAKITPITSPAWCKITAEGYVYIVKKLAKAPATYSTPAYISRAPVGAGVS